MCESSAGAAAGIQAIDKGSVHRICSGQVVLNLATAIKELVENSIDAGANNIEIRLKDHGSELIEVVDNGSGVETENFSGLTLKHHTSKLKDFSDLINVDTFGFRGEALSSLCALSKLTIVTCHKSTQIGTKLEYDHNGKLVKQTPYPRQHGTTVSVENVFSTLPVRHKEFQRNIKKEFTKAIQVLNAYCMISTGVRITCTNQVGKGKKSIVVSTGGNMTVKENITNIFGAKQAQSLLELVQVTPTEEIVAEYGIKDDQKVKHLFEISGYLSSSEHGQGRSSSDRQFFFINSRPCDPQKISRLVNEVYHMYNRYQNPFVMMNISLAKESVDVNVTPDKRQIFIQEERLLLAIIKSSLVRLFEPKSSVYRIAQPGLGVGGSSLSNSFSRQVPVKSPESCQSNKKSLTSTLASLKRSFSSAFSKETAAEISQEQQSKQRKLDTFLTVSTPQTASSDASFVTLGSISPQTSKDETSSENLTESVADSAGDSQTSGVSSADTETLSASVGNSGDNMQSDENCKTEIVGIGRVQSIDAAAVQECGACDTKQPAQVSNPRDDGRSSDPGMTDEFSVERANLTGEQELDSCQLSNSSKSPGKESVMNLKGSSLVRPVTSREHDEGRLSLEQFRHNTDKSLSSPEKKESAASEVCSSSSHSEVDNSKGGNSEVLQGENGRLNDVKVTFTEYDELSTTRKRKELNLPFSVQKLKERLAAQKQEKKSENKYCRSFRARINPEDNVAAESELQKEISKDMFTKMEILGQFNLGFIIVKLGQDLFIVDQHATDEKFNFETLQKETVIQGQKLIQPQNLELTASNECILLDNLEIFRKNGFEFVINEDGLPMERVKLVTMPVSRNWTFGKEDIEELIFMLSDSPGVMCRPSRIRAMFASRACRKSIMIGTALNHSQMRKLVQHMGEIDQPWNCPHGRPTMRHLINLDMLPH